MGPDLDALFGADDADVASAVHPALDSAVKALVADAWPVARGELLGEEAGGSKARLPLAPALARDMDATLEDMQQQAWSDCRAKAQKIRSEAWSALMRDKGWQRPCDKELFILVELILALCAHASGLPAEAWDCFCAVEHADGAFVFAAAGPFRSTALLFVRLLDDDARELYQSKEGFADGFFPETASVEIAMPSKVRTSKLQKLPSAPGADELKELLKQRRPFLFSKTDWPAARRWRSLRYLDEVAGHRLVPTELGKEVGAAAWKEELMPFGRFLKELVAPSCSGHGAASTTAYLAQHELFEQCPVLRADVPVPSEWHEVLGPPSRCNAWIGTNSTLTPCHWDSYDNFLSQVQGFKRLILLAPDQHSKLHVADAADASGTSAQGNISPINVEECGIQWTYSMGGHRGGA
eukprot:s963_g16.t1